MMKKLILFIFLAAVAAGLVSGYLFLRTSRAPKKIASRETSKPKKVVAEIKKTLEVKERGKVAIVLDDCGYNVRNLEKIFALDIPITFSILPHLAYSKRVAEHLPLEPHEKNKPVEKITILCSMERDEVLRELDSAIASVPGLAGISNHMGSKATEDERLMGIIFERVKQRGLFFMDNIVTANSVCKQVAQSAGIKLARRSVFLDNKSDIDYIKGQIQRLERLAIKTGWAIGVGHDRPNTLTAIEEIIPAMKKKGIKFVFLSELAK